MATHKRYPYSEELKPPLHVGNTDYTRLPARWGLCLIERFFRGRAARYMPQGVRKRRIMIPAEHGDVPCYVVEPRDDARMLPAMLYAHGGAFVFPLQTYMLRLAAHYAAQVGCRVFVPDYRLSMRAPFPAALLDCRDTLRTMQARREEYKLDMDRLILYGDSAGGCLAASLAHLCRDENTANPVAQFLIYPVTDNTMNHPSMREYARAVWSAEANRHMWALYLRGEGHSLDRYAVPMACERFDGLPPAYVEAAEMDTLRDEAAAYAGKLLAAGTPVEYCEVKGAYHGFDSDFSSPLVKRLLARRCERMRATIDG